LNQREYSWEEKQVAELFQDFSKAISGHKSSYFLGTIVLTQPGEEVPEVADGQQRLATTTILLAASPLGFLCATSPRFKRGPPFLSLTQDTQ
jgi:uncharacterized protein with ParB-like and HNH nuclease domain